MNTLLLHLPHVIDWLCTKDSGIARPNKFVGHKLSVLTGLIEKLTVLLEYFTQYCKQLIWH